MLSKILAAIGLLFLAYGTVLFVARWDHRTTFEKIVCWILLVFAGHWCLTLLMR
jgi:hypothetical protein